MFFYIKRGEETKVVKASNFQELCLQATSKYKVNPNSAIITFTPPSGQSLILDSEDTFEFLEFKVQEQKSANPNYDPCIVLSGGDEPISKPQLEQPYVSQVSKISVMQQQEIRPVMASEIDDSETILDDRSTIFNAVVNKNGEVVQPAPLDTLIKANSDGKDQAPLNMSQPVLEPSKSQVNVKSLIINEDAPNSMVEGVAESVSVESKKLEQFSMNSPKLSEIPIRIDSQVSEDKDGTHQQRNIGFAGQRTQKMLNDLGSDAAGMGMAMYDNESDYMIRQPTVIEKEAPIVDNSASQPQIDVKLEAPQQQQQQIEKPAEKDAAMDDGQFDDFVRDINKNSFKQERAMSQIGTSSSQVQPSLKSMPTQIEMASVKMDSQVSLESETSIRRMDTNKTEMQRLPSQSMSQQSKLIAAQNVAPAAQQPPQQHQNLQVPVDQGTVNTSFVTDLSMKEYSVYGGNHPGAKPAQLTINERKLTMQLNQHKQMLKDLTPAVQKQRIEILKLKALVEELEQKNSELMNQQHMSQAIPCLRCDGRQTEKGRPDPCRRCKGTGRVNTKHEKVLLEMIQAQIEKQVPVSIQQKDLKQKNLAVHPGVTCYTCKSSPLQGTRYMCLTCENLNICENCEIQSQHSRIHAMAVIHEPKLSPDELLENQTLLSERRQAIRAQEIISQSLIKQDSTDHDSKSRHEAKFHYSSLKKNFVTKAGDNIQQIWTFKNTGATKIPKGVGIMMIKGDQEFNVPSASVQQDVNPNEYFKLKISVKAPSVSKHYSAQYQLIDEIGNYFGSKVELDVIVEDDCSDSVILQEMMDNPDMSMSMGMIDPSKVQPSPRNERTSMMIHRPDMQKPQVSNLGQINPGANQQPQVLAWPSMQQPSGQPVMMPNQGMQPNIMPQMGLKPQPPASPMAQNNPLQQPLPLPLPQGNPMQAQYPQMPPQVPLGQPQQPSMQFQNNPQNPQMPVQQPPIPQAQPQSAPMQPQGWGYPPPPSNFHPPQQQPEKSAFDDSISRDSLFNSSGMGMAQPNPSAAAQPWAVPVQSQPAMQPSAQPVMMQQQPPQQPPVQPAQDFFNQGPMRYPTMTGISVDAAGVMGNKQNQAQAPVAMPYAAPEESKARPVEAKPAQPPVQEYGNKPPSLSNVGSISGPTTYGDKLEQAYPVSKNASDPSNREMREAFFSMKDFGYDNFEKNVVVLTKFKQQGKLGAEHLASMAAALEPSYNGGNQNAAAAAQASQAAAGFIMPGGPIERKETIVMDNEKIAYSTKLTKKKLKDPQNGVMLQLMEFGYTDYDKNYKIVKGEGKKLDINKVIDKLNAVKK